VALSSAPEALVNHGMAMLGRPIWSSKMAISASAGLHTGSSARWRPWNGAEQSRPRLRYSLNYSALGSRRFS
ncbi:MAG: hypothetical protein ABI703_09830, partial [Gemmatimonadales bacterium]